MCSALLNLPVMSLLKVHSSAVIISATKWPLPIYSSFSIQKLLDLLFLICFVSISFLSRSFCFCKHSLQSIFMSISKTLFSYIILLATRTCQYNIFSSLLAESICFLLHTLRISNKKSVICLIFREQITFYK